MVHSWILVLTNATVISKLEKNGKMTCSIKERVKVERCDR